MTDTARILGAIVTASNCAMVDGACHKQWVIDQMLRSLLQEDYDTWVRAYNENDGYQDWDTGIAP